MVVTAVVAVALLMLIAPARADSGGATSAFLVAELAGSEEVPGPGDPDGDGLATIDVDASAGEICYTLLVANIATATAAHIHTGAAGTTGAPVVTLQTPDATGFAEACQPIDATLAQQIIDGPAGFYVNVHNADYRDGAIRGQLGAPAGGGCILLASTEDSPVPSTSLTVTVGEEVLLEGLLQPDSTVVLTFEKDGTPVGAEEGTTDELGYFVASVVFEPGDESVWTITAAVPDTECSGSVTLTVQSAGPVRTVSIVKYECTDALPAEFDRSDIPDSCRNVVLPGDGPDLPDGYTAPNFGGEVSFDIVLTEPGGERAVSTDASLDGGFTCDPATSVCDGGFAYRFDFVPGGELTLEETDAPPGTVLEAVILVDGTDKGATETRVTVGAGGTVPVPASLDGDVVALFFNVQGSEAPVPGPTQGELPDTAASVQSTVALSWLVLPLIALIGVSALGLVAGRRR